MPSNPTSAIRLSVVSLTSRFVAAIRGSARRVRLVGVVWSSASLFVMFSKATRQPALVSPVRDSSVPFQYTTVPNMEYRMSEQVSRVAVVTGGASGIGEGIVRQFVSEGGRCVIADLQVERARDLVEELGDAVIALRTDVTQEADVAQAVDVAVEQFGQLDAMFNNAGMLGAIGSIVDHSLDAWERTINVLQTSVFLGIREAARVMIPAGGGAIVNTASTAGVRGGLGPHAYTTAKFAVRGLTESTAVELSTHNIRVNAVAPGRTVSGLTASLITGDPDDSEATAKHMASRSANGRAAYPGDIAAAAVFLASEQAWYVSGSCLVVDGAGESLGDKARSYYGSPMSVVGPALRNVES